MAGYIRQDVTNNIADGNVVNASDFDNEYNAIEAAFHATTGHTHDGTAAEGAAITKIGPTQDVVASATALTPKTDNTVDLGSSALEYKDLYIDGTANIDSLVADTADINAGTIDGVTIGGASAGAATFTTATATTGNITTVNATTVDTTNVEVSNIKAKDGTASMTLADATGVASFSAAPVLTALSASQAVFTNGSKALVSNAITGTGNVVMSTSPTLVTPALGTPTALVGTNITGTATAFNINGTVGATTPAAGAFTTLSASSTVTLSGGTANGVLYLDGSKLATSGSVLTFNGTILGVNGVNVGRGAGAVATNTAVGASALNANTTGATNTAVGYQAAYSNTTGALNVAVGTEAAYSNQTGSGLVAIGYRAAYSNTANMNVAIGYRTMRLNTSGTRNIAIGGNVSGDGTATLEANLTSTDNIAVGCGALQAHTTLHNNVAIGSSALASDVSGSENTAVGGGALFANQSGQNLTALGFAAGNSNTTGSSSTYVGHGAGYLNTTGSFNVAIGRQALYSNTTASNNTAVGYQALNLSTGSTNAGFGYLAGSAITTGTKNTIIGSYTGNQGGLDIRTSSNYIVLSDGDGNPRQVIDSSGRLLLGASTSVTAYFGAASLQAYSTGDRLASFMYAEANGSGPQINLIKSRGAAPGTRVIVNNGDLLGGFYFIGDDGVDLNQAGASIESYVDGTPGANDMPGRLVFYTTADGSASLTERMRLNSSGNLLVGTTTNNASGGVIQVSNGITFPATQSASSDANTLDDYEEGTWTPTIEGTTTAGTATYTSRVGRYTKIGRVVQIECYVQWSAGTGTGNLQISGLPFTSANATVFPQLSVSSENLALTASNYLIAYVNNNATTVAIAQNPTGGGARTLVAYDAAAEILITGTYSV